jgi:hypothetical protein
VQVHYDEGVAIHIGPEPCVGVRKDGDEASVWRARPGGPDVPRAGRGGPPAQARHQDWGGALSGSSLVRVLKGGSPKKDAPASGGQGICRVGY